METQAAGWQARIELGFARRADRTVLAHKRQLGPLAVQRPFYPEGGPCHTYLLHPPGGIVGGDSLEIEALVGVGAHALVTTPGASKLYRSVGASAHQTQCLRVAGGGTLEWLPQETIFFPGAKARMCTRVDLEPNARFIGWELYSLGRPAVGERFASGRADLSFRLSRLPLDRLEKKTSCCCSPPACWPSGARRAASSSTTRRRWPIISCAILEGARDGAPWPS
jgi:urease accessory protein